MGKTPDRHPGPLEEDENITLEPQAVLPAINGQFCYIENVGFRFYEEGFVRGLDNFNRLLLQVDGSLVYTGDGEITLKEE